MTLFVTLNLLCSNVEERVNETFSGDEMTLFVTLNLRGKFHYFYGLKTYMFES